MVCSSGKFQLFIFVCSGFWSSFAKTFIVLIGRKSCCPLGFLFREAKDVVACLTLGLKG
jgi:hypothetical protein